MVGGKKYRTLKLPIQGLISIKRYLIQDQIINLSLSDFKDLGN